MLLGVRITELYRVSLRSPSRLELNRKALSLLVHW